MKYSGHRKLLCELSKLSKLNASILLGYLMNTDPSILVYKFRPERTGFNMYAEYKQPQLTFLALVPWVHGIQKYHLHLKADSGRNKNKLSTFLPEIKLHFR